jgi:NAD(P)-dependent dehydrogenase (short-subunit alcohol dehydrogenase family)
LRLDVGVNFLPFFCKANDKTNAINSHHAVYPSELTEGLIASRTADSGWPKSWIPEERAGDVEDMAGTVLFLASKAGAYINGNILVTDGGRLGILPSAY